MLDRPAAAAKPIDYEKINRRALKHWVLVHSLIVDLKGNPLGDVLRLNPAATHKRRLSEFRMTENGWVNLGPAFSASGKDTIEVLQYLGACDRRTAAEFLADILDRIVEVAA